MRQVMVWLILGVLMSSPAAAQSWETERLVDDFTDETQITVQASGQNGDLRLSVSCRQDGSFRMAVANVARQRETTVDSLRRFSGRELLGLAFLMSPDDGEARWDGGEVERFEFPRDDDAFVSKLLAHRELSMRVGGGTGTTDGFDLTGAADALAVLECAP